MLSSRDRRRSGTYRQSTRHTLTLSNQTHSSLSLVQSVERPSPRLAETPLWGPRLWSHLLAAEKQEKSASPPAPAPGWPTSTSTPTVQSRPRRYHRNPTPYCLSENSESSSEEPREKPAMSLTCASQGHGELARFRRRSASVIYNEKDMFDASFGELSTKEANRVAALKRKRNTPQSRQKQPDEHPQKILKTKETSPKSKGSSQLPISLDDESDDDIILAHPLPRRDESATTTKTAKGIPEQKKFFQGLGSRNLRNTGQETERSTRSASRNLDQYQKGVVGISSAQERIADLEREVKQVKQDYEARIKALQSETEDKLQHVRRGHEAQMDTVRREHDSQMEMMRKEAQSCLDDVQKTAAAQEKTRAEYVTKLETENQSLKDQLKSSQIANEKLVQTLDQREILIDSEESIKALEAKNKAQSQKLETLKPETMRPRPTSPTPTLSSSFPTSDETKTTNVRSIFLLTKKRHDILRAACKRISDVTCNMDLGAFGEFGRSVRDLRQAMKSADEEDGVGGSQRSSEGRQ